jgi:hypothetical protein
MCEHGIASHDEYWRRRRQEALDLDPFLSQFPERERRVVWDNQHPVEIIAEHPQVVVDPYALGGFRMPLGNVFFRDPEYARAIRTIELRLHGIDLPLEPVTLRWRHPGSGFKAVSHVEADGRRERGQTQYTTYSVTLQSFFADHYDEQLQDAIAIAQGMLAALVYARWQVLMPMAKTSDK